MPDPHALPEPPPTGSPPMRNPNMARNSKHGAACELIVCADLIRKGYEVFRNVCGTGAADVIAVKDSRIIGIEVRQSKHLSKNGSPTGHSKKLRTDVLAAVVVPLSRLVPPEYRSKCQLIGT